jgi:isoleucyl-tRNA synthetase
MQLNFPQLEKKILKFWKENEIFKKSIERRKRAKDFVFFEGPPTANAKAGIHHVLSRVFKDIICRYKTMRGFKVIRKAGWDTHGLPVELEIEKKLGLKSKKDIEKYGISKFNKKCKESVWNYKKDWERLTERIGFWLDLENPYITYETNYIETVWWILKEIYKKGLLYQDYKVVPYCPRCQTTLSTHEVALGYEKIKEPAIYVKFKILNPEFKDTSLLVWTTTPWTLPGNVAIAVNPKFIYSKVKIGDELAMRTSFSSSPSLPSEAQYLILAKERLSVLARDYELIKEFQGKDLINLRYEPLYPPNEEILKIAYQVLPADFVSLEEGTGLVHIAPAFGEEDMELIKKLPEFPILLTVDNEGKFKLEVKKWARMFVKEADPLIIEDLKNRELLFKEELYEHDYPFCWRCHTPLLYYAKKSWFIRMTKMKRDLIKNNQKINWIPSHLKKGRFGEWLKEIKDWAISRERYWGTPLPIWQCKECGKSEVIGSKADLVSQNFSNNNYLIFRHGHSLRQVKNVAVCWPEKIYCPLTKKGEEETKIAAERLRKEKIDLIFSSDLLRTKQTAEIVAKEIGAKVIFDKRLREYDIGIFNGKPTHLAWQYFKEKRDWLSVKLPKGESLLLLRKRMVKFLKDIDRKYKNKNILIISHELPLTILEYSLKGLPLEKIIRDRREGKIKKIETGEFRKIKFKNLPFNEKMELDFHRPYIDEVKFYCPHCHSLMERVPEVIDCWFDSGSMPFAQAHYPFAFAQKSKIKNQKFLFPADFISEGIDQTRGWFYTLLAISTLLGLRSAYKNVISLGHVLDEKGEKMSKSKGNVVDPWLILEKYGADTTRWYFYTVNQPGDSKLFSEKDIDQALKKFILTLWNSFQFYKTYVPHFLRPWKMKYKNILDKWIVSRLNLLIKDTTQKLDKYDVTDAARLIENFVIEDLSLWYIRRSRRRFHPLGEQSSLGGRKTGKDFEEASTTLGFVLLTLSKLTAPFIPFLSEEIYRKCQMSNAESRPFFFIKGGTRGKKRTKFSSPVKCQMSSVHLEDWPRANKKLIDRKLNKKMEKVREVVTQALAERAKTGIKVRQPLAKLQIANGKFQIEKELLDLIKEEVNVREITFGKTLKLDTKITPELREEGIIREIIRNLQEMRKIAGLTPKDIISIQFEGEKKLKDILLKNQEKILKVALARDLKFSKKGKFELERAIKIEGKNLWFAIKKIK